MKYCIQQEERKCWVRGLFEGPYFGMWALDLNCAFSRKPHTRTQTRTLHPDPETLITSNPKQVSPESGAEGCFNLCTFLEVEGSGV